jgi:opacity protein-like surface antigen
MGSFQFKTTIAGLLALASATTAHAADLLPPPPMPAPVEFGGGWYLRGDVGVGSLDFKGTTVTDASTPASPYDLKGIQNSVSDQVFVGAGIGYQLNPWLRFDVTGEYRTKTDWQYTDKGGQVCNDATGICGYGYNISKGQFSSIVGLANAYFDLGTWYGITPFVGGGVGFAHHMFGNSFDIGAGSSTGAVTGVAGGFGMGPTHDQTSLAWAIHAGLGYDVTPNLKLELAYRYLNMGEAETGRVGCAGTCSSNSFGTIYKLKELESHDIKIGMRWILGGPVAPMPASYGAPIIRKY